MVELKLKEIIEEIESAADYYKRTPFDEVRKSYDHYVKLIILELPKSEQYDLCDYWDTIKWRR